MPLDAVQATNTGATNEERLAAMREVQQIARRRDAVNGEYRACLKRWKAAGIAIKPMLATIQASKRDADDVRLEMRETVHNMSLRGIIELATTGTTPDFLAGLDTRVAESARTKQNEWVADDQGYKAGRDGVAIDDSPYIAGTEADLIWRKAWGDGRTAADVAAGPNATMADASRERPERDEDAEAADNVVPLETTGQLTGGVPNPKKKDKGKAEKKGGKGKNAPKSAPGRKGPARKAAARKQTTNGKGTHPPQRLLLTDEAAPRKRGRPSNAEIAARKAAAVEAGRGDLV